MGKIKSYFAEEIEANYEASEPERSMAESQIPNNEVNTPEVLDEENIDND